MSTPSRKGRKKKDTFGATSPPFIDYLKDILHRYPDGGQILKELIQNADDARASDVVFIHDERTYEKDSLWSQDLDKYQGPALYAFNNAVFTDEDWHGIQATGRSVKRNDPNRVGRFGIGFNSVYHITDVPSIFSSKYLGMLDPQEKIFGERKGGFQWSMDDDDERHELLTLKDQFHPFRDIVQQVSNTTWEKATEEDQYFQGTLFRFPLRSESSEISDNLYDSNKVVELFESFIEDADISLLFLRHVSSVTLMHIDSSGSAVTRFNVSLSSITECSDADSTDSCSEGTTVCKTICAASPSEGEKETKWLVTTYRLTEGEVMKIDSLAEKLCYSPQVDLAFPCDPENLFSDGRLSCFLPLPNNESNRTGLPVHINACFGLTDNRRHIKWQDADQKNDETAQWNEILMTDVLPLTYLKMVLDAIQCCKNSILSATSVYKMWPKILQMRHKEKWHAIATDVLKRLLNDQTVFSLAKDEKIWVTPSEAVFPADDVEDPALTLALATLLVAEGENLTNIPQHVISDVRHVLPEPDTLQWVTPQYARDVLHRSTLEDVSRHDKLSFLEYVLSDGKYEELEGLQLLPLSSGTFKTFSDWDGECTALIDSEEFPRELLPFCKDNFVSQELSTSSLYHLGHMATKGLFKILKLDSQNIADFTKEHLPHDWKTGKGSVTWDLDNPEHPQRGWLAAFWKYLNSHWDDLSHFIGIPIVPVEPLGIDYRSVILAKLEENPTMMFQHSKHSSLSEQIQNVVRNVGGIVIKRDECLKHNDMETFVFPPSPKSLLKVFLNVSSDQVIGGIHSTLSTEKEELKSFISSLDSLSNEEQNIVSQMPLFQLMSGEYVCAKGKLAVVLNSSPTIPFDLPIPNSVIQCATEADRRLLTMLKVELLDTSRLALHLVSCIETGFSPQNEKKTMLWILQHGAILFSQNGMLHEKCKELKFVETGGQCLKEKASNMYDPNNDTFKKIFETKFFPSSDYTMTKQMLHSLKQLGLKSKEKDISSVHVLAVVETIENTQTGAKTWEKADTLLRVLNDNDILSTFTYCQLEHLQNTQWFPCGNPSILTKDLNEGNQKKAFYKPCEVRHARYHTVVGHVMPLISELSEKVCRQLGMLSPPPAEKVMENLSVLNKMSQTMHDLEKDAQFKRTLHDSYTFMQDNIGLFRELIKNNNSAPCLWIDNHFVSPNDVVLAYPSDLDLTSYIEKVPEEYLPFEKLWLELGVKSTLSTDEIENILHDIKDRIDQRNPPFGHPSELKVSVNVLNWMRKMRKPADDDTPVPVQAQNQMFTLQPASTAVFCDISQEGLTDLREDHEDFYVLHEEVLPVTAEWLGIPLLSTRILKPEFIGIEQCGQTEPITQRIKNILREYDEDGDIFKELLQNAEDTGAKTCSFMVDFRKHTEPPDGLIDSGMSLCSGPCLWTFNDELFSDEDWKNITKVGSASKEEKVEKIGKFGIGFNAVYHVTDVPSILSGKKLLIFDPNVTHLKKIIKNPGNPGIKLDLFHERIFRRFPGQFRSFEGIFDCDFSEKSTEKFYNGTLMKLPFRTPEESEVSEISTKVYDTDRIIEFEKHLTEKAQTHLLFLRNVENLSLLTLPENATTPPKKDQTKSLLHMTRKVVETVEITDGIPKELQRRCIKSLTHQYPKCAAVIDVHKGTITEIMESNTHRSDFKYWLLFSCLGIDSSLKMALENELNTVSLPIGGVAVPLIKDTQSSKWTASKISLIGQAFSFLPMSIQTGLPVNINASFAVMSNRKCLWETGPKADWNRALLKDAVTNAYISALLVLKKLSEEGSLSDYQYYTFWPNKEEVGTAFQPLVQAFYSAIAEGFCKSDLELFSDGKGWCSLDKVRFLDPSIAQHKGIGTLAESMFQCHQSRGTCAVSLPSWVRKSLINSGFEDIVKRRTLSWADFFREVVLTNLHSLPCHERNSIILSAIDLSDDGVDELLKGHRCIPSKSGELLYIKKTVNPTGKVACLYDEEEGRFLDDAIDEFRSPKRIQRLIALGMLNDHLPLEDVTERACAITKVWEKNKNKAVNRLQCLFELMEELPVDKKSHHWSSLQNTPFIPALLPVNVQSNSGEFVTLKKPIQVYHSSCRNLVNMTEFTVDHDHLKIHKDNKVLEKLGVRKEPPIYMVLRQLDEASKCNVPDQPLFAKIAHDCYYYFNEWLNNEGDPTQIAEFAESVPFVFVENKFVHVRSVAKAQDFEAKPYLFALPSRFSKFNTLWDSIGLQQHFTPQQFATVLHEIESRYGANPLSDADLNICLDILCKCLLKTDDAASQNYLVPDENSVLRPSSELHYNDSPWMPAPAVTLCHNRIAREAACHFGVKTTRHHTLLNHLDDGFPFYAEEFGQHEDLTVRIRNIINAYPSKKDIVKELIQNADDAEATEIHFVWDQRKHGTEKTFDKKWNSLQGAALCVYNNKVFTEADLKGIQRLGEGGKRGEYGKTGKFGLGFNSVYHLTDCPAIITGDEWLCVSDPHVSYLNLATKQSPGCKFKLEEDFKKSFTDVYDTFLPSNFKLTSGTMFRFPLRPEEMAWKSEICKVGVTEHHMKELLDVFAEDSDGLILFLKHIKKIQLHTISPDSNELECMYTIEKELSEESKASTTHFQNSVVPSQVFYSMTVSSSDQTVKGQSQWIVAEQFGSRQPNPAEILLPSLCEMNVEPEVLPHAAVAACIKTKSTESEFTGKLFCSLPLPGSTGLPVHINGNFEVDSSRRDLWKEDEVSLKTEWNESLKLDLIAHLYADLLKRIQTTIETGEHNSVLLLGMKLDETFLKFFPPIARDTNKEWHTMINHVYQSISERDLSVIPILHTSQNAPAPLASKTSLTTHFDLKSFDNKKYTVSWSNMCKDSPVNSPHFTTAGIESAMHSALEDLGMGVVPWSSRMACVAEGFKAVDVKVREVCPHSVREFLKEKPLNDAQKTLAGLPLPIDQTLLKNKQQWSLLLDYCMRDIDETNMECLDGLPLLLTKDKMLRTFDRKSPIYFSRFWEIFQGHQAIFIDQILDLNNRRKLQEAGCITKLTISVAAKLLKPLLEELKSDNVPPAWLKNIWEFFSEEIRFEGSNLKGEQKGQCFEEIKEAFIDYPIVPIIIPSQKNKKGLQTMRNISSLVWDQEDLRKIILLKLGLMQLNHKFFYGISQLKTVHLKPEVLDTDDRSAVLEQLLKVPHSSFKHLSGSELDYLLQFLQSGVNAAKNSQGYLQKIRSLPLFETVQGKRQTISGNGNVFILKIDQVCKFPDLFNIDADQNIFLKHNLVNEALSKSMEIPILTDLDFFVKFLLPSLHILKHAQVLNCIRLLLILKGSSTYESVEDQIIGKLKDVTFIPDIHGTPQVASYYFSETQDLYKVMLPREKFVPSAFWKLFKEEKQKVVRKFLYSLGLKHDVSDAEIIEFANMIQSEAKSKISLKELQRKSSVLFKEALSQSDKSSKSNKSDLLNQIANIKFVFPVQIQKELCDYHKPFAGERDLVSIKGSLLETSTDDKFLIWSSMPILQTGRLPQSAVAKLIKVGALDQPPAEFVAKHLSNICQSRCQGENSMAIRKMVFMKSYGYLQLKEFNGSQLQDFPVVLVDNETVLVKPSQAVLSLDNHENFRPYLFKINPKLAIFSDFFKSIGVEESPTTVQYSTVLQDIYMDSKGKETLNPNQQMTVTWAIQNLFRLIKHQSQEAVCLKKLYLPSTDGKLYLSNDLYFNDTSFQTTRLEHSLKGKVNLLMNLGHCHLNSDPYEHQRLLQFLPKNICPAMLSSVISERCVTSTKKVCEYGKNCEFSGFFERHLSSGPFSYGLTCLIRQQSNGTIAHDVAVEQCKKTFGKLQITCCESLATELFLNEERLADTTSDAQVCVIKDAEGCTFYLKHCNEMAPKVINEVTMTLSQEINALLQNCLSHFMQALSQLLLCDTREDVDKTLEKWAIRNSESRTEGFQNAEPGSPIPEEWLDALDMNVMNNYEMGEFVGFKKTPGEENCCYAIVTERLDSPDKKSHRRYKIQIGIDEYVEVSSLDLYQIKRGKTSAPVQSASRDLELLAGGPVPSSERNFPNNFEDIKKEIDQRLKEIWTLSKDEQQKAIRRMYLLWHPDKNPGEKELATEAFKYLKNKIKEFQQNGHCRSSSGDFRGQRGTGANNWSWDFEEFFSQWDFEASRHRQGRQRFHRNNHRSHYDFWSFHQEMPRPDKEEAKRWYSQAQCDLNAAYLDTGVGSTEWCFFKIHQAVEKALIAAEYRRSGKYSIDRSISSRAQEVSGCHSQLLDLPSLVKRLKDLGVDPKTTQYPNFHPPPKIPNNTFKPEHEKEALDIASELLQKVGTYLQ